MLPYGRASTKCGIITTVTNLVESLPKRDKHRYICAMDNYFTYHRAIENCVKAGVEVVGTAKPKRTSHSTGEVAIPFFERPHSTCPIKI